MSSYEVYAYLVQTIYISNKPRQHVNCHLYFANYDRSIFKFGIPVVEKNLCEYLVKTTILSTYYLLFDIFLAVITPYMFCFASAMTILEERDANISNYLSVTPVGKSGYLISRLGFPTAISSVFSIIMLLLFSLTDISVLKAIVLSILTAPIGTIIALLVVSLSANKVEGMALAKLGGMIMLGVAIPFFITDTLQYFGAFLPSFWVAKAMLEFRVLHLVLVTPLQVHILLTECYKHFQISGRITNESLFSF